MLSPRLLEELRAYWRGLRRKPKERLFPGNRWHTSSQPVTTKVLWSASQIAAERAGLDNRRIHPHTLRHCFNCSAAHSKTQRRRHHRTPTRLIHSGTAQSAAELCASSKGSPPRNFCFACHLNRTAAQHEALSTSSAFAGASAHKWMPCLFLPKPLGCQLLQHLLQDSTSQHAALSRLSVIGRCQTQPVPDSFAPAQTDAKYIAFHEGGFLQVAVSEAPHRGYAAPHYCASGRSRYSTKTSRE